MAIYINLYNKYLIYNNYIYDMNSIKYLSNIELYNLLFFKKHIYYYKHKEVPKQLLSTIYKNRNIGNRISIKRGLITNRCYGKYLPSNIILYNNINDNYFDSNQALELNLGLPIYIIHQSKNKLWYFIKTYNYYCWIEKKYVTIVNKKIFNKYLNPKKFVIAMKDTYINNIFVNMGTKYPINKIIDNNIFICIPGRVKNKYNEINVKVNNIDFNTNFLSYNYNNFFKQAFTYLNTPYGWGGINNGIDCSGLIVNILKTFNILIPRDTSKQKKTVGTIIYNLNKCNISIIKKYITTNDIILFYTDKHVMIYYKTEKEKIYILHASSKYKKVVISLLDNTTINNIKSIHILKYYYL